MLKGEALYSISYHKPDKFVRLTWLPGTAGMTDQDFKEVLDVFAECALRHRAERLMIDVREFKHRPSAEVLAWRDDVIVPKYQRAGVRKVVWLWPGAAAGEVADDSAPYANR